MTPREAVDAAFEVQVGTLAIRPTQVRGEIAELVGLVEAAAPKRVLEIGTDNGGTLFLLAWASARDARLLSVDVRQYGRLRRALFESFGRGRQRVSLYTGDSHSEETRIAVQRYFRTQPLDMLFIDGDHAYDGVRRDYELYAPLVRPGGLIAFHDIVEGPESSVGGVPRFWREVRSDLRDVNEIVESSEQGGYGVGVGVKAP
jgi:predicted O-methyltransferase YrrM